jgi:hypothetical protein
MGGTIFKKKFFKTNIGPGTKYGVFRSWCNLSINKFQVESHFQDASFLNQNSQLFDDGKFFEIFFEFFANNSSRSNAVKGWIKFVSFYLGELSVQLN